MSDPQIPRTLAETICFHDITPEDSAALHIYKSEEIRILDGQRKALELRNAELTAENKRLNGIALHMAACRALLNVPDDEVLHEAIRELTARIAELERRHEEVKRQRDRLAASRDGWRNKCGFIDRCLRRRTDELTEARKDGQRYIYRDYWNAEQTHRPYCNEIHDLKDEKLFQLYHLEPLFTKAGIADGDEIEIIVRKTGNRPFGNRIWKLIEPHRYGPVDDAATPLPEKEAR